MLSAFIIVLFFSVPVYAFVRTVRSLLGKNKIFVNEETAVKFQIIEICYFVMVLGIIGFGLFLNDFGEEGGVPLLVYEMNENAATSYASLAPVHVPTVVVFLVLSSLAYWQLSTKDNQLSPVVQVLSSSLLILNILFAIVYIAHTGFLNYGKEFSINLSIFFLQIGYVSLSLLYIAKLKDSLDNFLKEQETHGEKPANKFLLLLYKLSFQYRNMPVLWGLFLFPVLLAVQLVLVLFGQRPDSAIRVFLDTSSFAYSRMPAPKPEIVAGDGHYLCTVSARGHKKLVKPVRAGIRHGNRIVVNRQLLVANAFENILEQYTPNCHKVIRRFYDRYGYPISKHINAKWSADFVYVVMKPLEWLFVLVLYTVDKNPENRIHVQYSELRK